MAHPKSTDIDPKQKVPNKDELGSFDPFTALGYVSTDEFPGHNAVRSRYVRLHRFIKMMHPNRPHSFALADLNRARDALMTGWHYCAALMNSVPNRPTPLIYWDANASMLNYNNALAP